MNKNDIKEIIYMVLSVVLGILAVKFVIWLLPIILFFIISYSIYKSIKRNRINKQKTKVKKTIKIIEMVEDDN